MRYKEIMQKIAAENLRKAEKEASLKQTELKTAKINQASKKADAETQEIRDREKLIKQIYSRLRT